MLAASGGLTVKLGAIVLYRSTGGGVDWSPVPGLPGNSTIKAVIFSPAYGQHQTVFVARGTGLAVSIHTHAQRRHALMTESLAEVERPRSPELLPSGSLHRTA